MLSRRRSLALLLVVGLLAMTLASCSRSPGRVVGKFDLGGYQVFLYCLGEGEPTMLFDAGAGGNAYGLHDLVADAASRTRVCLWDRPGLGTSQAGPLPTSSLQIVGELRELLATADVPPPYLPVGFSFGGMNLRLFADQYADEVVGLVLIDPSHPDQFDRFAAVLPPRQPGETPELRSFRERDLGNPDVDMEASIEQVRGVTSLGDLPLVVVSRADDPAAMRFPGITEEVAEALHGEWMAMQEETSALSTRGRWVIAESAGHCVHCTEPALVVEALETILGVRSEDGVPAEDGVRSGDEEAR